MGDTKTETIGNKLFELGFDQTTGALISIRNQITGNEYLNGQRTDGNPFSVYHDFTKEFEIAAPENQTPQIADLPGDISRKAFTPSSSSASFQREDTPDGKSLAITYHDGETGLEVTIKVAVETDQATATMSFSVKNTGSDPIKLMCSFPMIGGLSLGTGQNNLMVVNDEAGYILPMWSFDGGIYGNAGQMSMQWGSVFDDDSGDAFGFIVRDPDLKNKQIRYHKPVIEVSYFPEIDLKPGQTIQLPDALLLTYAGDWKHTAAEYAQWLAGSFPPLPHADWIGSIGAHCGGWFEKTGSEKPERYPRVVVPLDSFEDLPRVYLDTPAEVHEFAFHCTRSMPQEVTGKPMLWTDADNVIRSDLGGAASLKEGIGKIHDMGFRFSFYVEGYLCPGDAEIVVHGNAGDWVVINKDGTNNGNYTREGERIGSGLLHMCPGAEGWQNHLAETAARLVGDTGADGVRLDSLGFYFCPCYNPLHNHESPFDYNKWLCDLFRKVEGAVRAVNPDCLLTTEAGSDFFQAYFHGALTQQPAPFRVSVSRDVAPMRVAAPDYKVFVYDMCGPVAASLMGYPGGSPGTLSTNGRMKELDRKWRSIQYPVADVIRWGDAAHVNPKTTRPDVACRRFSSGDVDVIIGARPDYPEGWNETYDLIDNKTMNVNVDIMSDPISYGVSVEIPGEKPTRGFIFNIEDLTAAEVDFERDGDYVRFTSNANWFMAVLLRQGAKPIAYATIPRSVSKGTTIEINSMLLGDGDGDGGERRNGILRFPGILEVANREISVPGVHQLDLPEDMPPGRYFVEIISDSFYPYRGFIEITD